MVRDDGESEEVGEYGMRDGGYDIFIPGGWEMFEPCLQLDVAFWR